MKNSKKGKATCSQSVAQKGEFQNSPAFRFKDGWKICRKELITIPNTHDEWEYEATFGVSLELTNKAEKLWERGFLPDGAFNLRRPKNEDAVDQLFELAKQMDGTKVCPYHQKLFLINNKWETIIVKGLSVVYLTTYNPKNPAEQNVWIPFVLSQKDIVFEKGECPLPIKCQPGTWVKAIRKYCANPIVWGKD